MALIRMEFFSNQLGMRVPATVILPERGAKGPHKVLWLLHGRSDDHSGWSRRTNIERYAEAMGLCVIMPSAHRSRYRDMAHGGKFFSYIADELPEIMRDTFSLSAAREDNYICGLSMGGEGALRIALLRPDHYAVAGCLSAGLSNYRASSIGDADMERYYHLSHGDENPANDMADMQAVARKLVDAAQPLPRIYHCCGTEDFLLNNARATRDFFLSLPGNPFGYTYEEDAGAHTWDYWDEHIKHFLSFIKG